MAENIFSLNYNVTGPERKRLADYISGFMGTEKKYLGAPTFAYQIGYITVSKDGAVSFESRGYNSDIDALMAELEGQGFHTEDAIPQTDSKDSTEGKPDGTAEDSVSERPAADKETAETPSEAGGLTVSLPLDGFSESSLRNLRKLVDAKSGLIRKALGADRLDIETSETRVSFPWFDTLPAPDETQAVTSFIAALGQMAKNSKRVTATEKDVENEKYAFRCFLLRLGFIGADNKVQRKILLRRLSGSSAFPSKEKADAFNERQKTKRTAQREAVEA